MQNVLNAVYFSSCFLLQLYLKHPDEFAHQPANAIRGPVALLLAFFSKISGITTQLLNFGTAAPRRVEILGHVQERVENILSNVFENHGWLRCVFYKSIQHSFCPDICFIALAYQSSALSFTIKLTTLI